MRFVLSGMVDKKKSVLFHEPSLSNFRVLAANEGEKIFRPSPKGGRADGGRGTFEIHSNSMMASRDSAWRKGGRRRRRTDGRALASPITGISIFLGGRAFVRPGKWGWGKVGRKGGRNEGELFLHEPHPNESVGRPTRVGSALYGKKWNQSKDGIDLVFFGRWTNHSPAPAALYSCV